MEEGGTQAEVSSPTACGWCPCLTVSSLHLSLSLSLSHFKEMDWSTVMPHAKSQEPPRGRCRVLLHGVYRIAHISVDYLYRRTSCNGVVLIIVNSEFVARSQSLKTQRIDYCACASYNRAVLSQLVQTQLPFKPANAIFLLLI